MIGRVPGRVVRVIARPEVCPSARRFRFRIFNLVLAKVSRVMACYARRVDGTGAARSRGCRLGGLHRCRGRWAAGSGACPWRSGCPETRALGGRAGPWRGFPDAGARVLWGRTGGRWRGFLAVWWRWVYACRCNAKAMIARARTPGLFFAWRMGGGGAGLAKRCRCTSTAGRVPGMKKPAGAGLVSRSVARAGRVARCESPGSPKAPMWSGHWPAA